MSVVNKAAVYRLWCLSLHLIEAGGFKKMLNGYSPLGLTINKNYTLTALVMETVYYISIKQDQGQPLTPAACQAKKIEVHRTMSLR